MKLTLDIDLDENRIRRIAEEYLNDTSGHWRDSTIKGLVQAAVLKSFNSFDLKGMIEAQVEERTKLAVTTAIDTFVQQRVGDIIAQMMKSGDIQRRIKSELDKK